MEKPIVFISHIREEQEIAIALKKLVEVAFLGMMDVFVSSDPTSVEMGQKWLSSIEFALKHCRVEIIIASPKSVAQPWVNFEVGAGWIQDIPVIPVCHSGVTPSTLPAPLSTLQGATATEEAELRNIFSVLAKAIECELPTVDFARFIEKVREFEEISKKAAVMKARTPITPISGLSPHEFATLVAIAEQTHAPDEMVSVYSVREEVRKAGFRDVAITLALSMLCRKDLIHTEKESDWNKEVYAVFGLTPEGWTWLEANQDRVVLIGTPNETTTETTSPDEDEF